MIAYLLIVLLSPHTQIIHSAFDPLHTHFRLRVPVSLRATSLGLRLRALGPLDAAP